MSYNQPGPYGGQPQQPGPYGGQPGSPYGQQQPQTPQPGYGYPQQPPTQQPGYGYPQQAPGGVPQQPPYGQAPYGAPAPGQPDGGKKKTGLIIGAVAVVAAIAVGAYFVLGSSGGGDLADDGPHKLTMPATVLSGEYKKAEGEGGTMTSEDVKDAEKWGVKNAEDVTAQYQTGKEGDNPLKQKMIQFAGVYGEIEDPEKTVDAFMSYIESEAGKEDDEITVNGDPKSYDTIEGAILKCQDMTAQTGASGEGPSEMTMTYCVWGDHSTLGFVLPMDVAALALEQKPDPADAADITAKFRKDVRVKA